MPSGSFPRGTHQKDPLAVVIPLFLGVSGTLAPGSVRGGRPLKPKAITVSEDLVTNSQSSTTPYSYATMPCGAQRRQYRIHGWDAGIGYGKCVGPKSVLEANWINSHRSWGCTKCRADQDRKLAADPVWKENTRQYRISLRPHWLDREMAKRKAAMELGTYRRTGR